MTSFFGGVPYCYSNSTAMALQNIGDYYNPGYIEALTAMGTSASIIPGDEKHPLILFSSWYAGPDECIGHVLSTLGYGYEEFYSMDISLSPDTVYERLAELLKHGPVIAGPLDMGDLTYLPGSGNRGSDHYVLVLEMDESYLTLHDPAGYPFVRILKEDFYRAWGAENIDYRRGSYSMWGNLQRISTPTKKDIFEKTSDWIRHFYTLEDQKTEPLITGRDAVLHFAQKVSEFGLSEGQQGWLKYFKFRLSAGRALDLAEYLTAHDSARAALKAREAALFGLCHSLVMENNQTELIRRLNEIAEIEKEFRSLSL